MDFALFFTTQGRSLKTWDRLGMLEREIKLYQHTARQFKTMYFFTYGSTDRQCQELLPQNVVIVPKPRLIPVFLYSFLLPFIHARILRHIDVFKTVQMDGSWTAVLAKNLYGGKLIVRCGYEWLQFIERSKRGWLKRSFAHWAEQLAYRNADIVIQTSQEAVSFARDRFAVPAEKMRIIPNFIDTALFAPSTATPAPGSIVYVGRLEPQKNVLALVEALAGLSATLTIIGQGSERGAVERMANEKHVQIIWKGTIPQKELPGELAKHSVFVLPSLYEGSPKTLLEAMSCGLPCIATDVIGSREVIQTGINGLLCGTDAASLRTAIQQLLNDEPLRHSMGEQARHTICATYSFEKVLEQEVAVYASL